jgi:hypothetical protein
MSTVDAVPPAPMIASWVSRLIFWPLPLWFFAALYAGVWLYALLLWRFVPPVLPGWTPRIIPRPKLPP